MMTNKIDAFERKLLDCIYETSASLVEMAYCVRLNIRELLEIIDDPEVVDYLKAKAKDSQQTYLYNAQQALGRGFGNK